MTAKEISVGEEAVQRSLAASSRFHQAPAAHGIRIPGQILVITAGTGRVQMWGHPIQTVHAGDVVIIPAHVKHWHGAAPDSSMSHLAIQDNLNGVAVDWLEHVTDAQFNGGK